jgi:hypothetical protein
MIREVILNAPAPPVQNPNWPYWPPNNPFNPYNPGIPLRIPYSVGVVDPLDFLNKIDPVLHAAVFYAFVFASIFLFAMITNIVFTRDEIRLNGKEFRLFFVLTFADATITYIIYKLFPFLLSYAPGNDMLVSMLVGLFLIFYEMHVLDKWKQEKTRKDFLREAKRERDEKL